MKPLKFTVLLSLFYVFSHSAQASTVFVDKTLSSKCSGSYNVNSRKCDGSAGSAYKTIQEAINKASIGDVIYMRGGTYTEMSIGVPQSKNGSAWTEGNFTTLKSYPGEWAKIDATGVSNTAGETQQAVMYGYQGTGTGEPDNYTEYWFFSNFEITGGGSGVHMKPRNVKWHYMYIHDNGRNGAGELQAGIFTVNPQHTEIKYSYFKDNIDSSSPNFNLSHIMFDADYRDDESNGGKGQSWLPNASTHHNVVAYNYFELTGGNFNSQHIAIRQKNQTRFGFNDRSPLDLTNKEFGDNIHHNIVVGSGESIGMGQDFLQVHHNITDNGINIGRFSDVPTTYNAVIYNNTIIDPSETGFRTSSGLTTSGSTEKNYYDNGSQQTVHPHIDFYNNITSGNKNSFHTMPYLLHWDMPENSTDPDQDNSDLAFERNFIHKSAHDVDINVGHNYSSSFSGCDLQDKSISDFNSCSDAWRGLSSGTVKNWANSSSGLFVGNSGASQYVTDHSFVVGGGKTICDGGKSGPHPYLTGVSIPGYVGATNPNDFAWVTGLLTDVQSVSWLRNQDNDPGWVEKNVVFGVCKAPPKPPTPTS